MAARLYGQLASCNTASCRRAPRGSQEKPGKRARGCELSSPSTASPTAHSPSSGPLIKPLAAETRAQGCVIVLSSESVIPGGIAMSIAEAMQPAPRRFPQQTDRVRARIEDLEMIARTHEALAILQPKWAPDLIFLIASGIRRHARLVDNRAGLSKKVLTATLRSLERHGIVQRIVYAEIPVRVEYSLTQLGWDLTETLLHLHDWAVDHQEELTSLDGDDVNTPLALVERT
jgi:DNA-binding HxlR family transcriptional regulator